MPDYARYPSLEGRSVFITGGSSGIGACMVTEYARQGAKVAFVGLDDLPARGLSHRPELWRQALAYAESHPLVGYGAGTRLSFRLPGDLELHMPHNILLSALLQGGAVAAGLLAAVYAALLLAAWRARSGPDRIALPLLVFGLVCGMVDRKVELASLSVEYLTLWFPAALLLGAAARRRRTGRSGS